MKQSTFNNYNLPAWVSTNHPSYMEKLIACSAQPDFISFALGLPALEFFPVADFQNAVADVIAQGSNVFQYMPPLMELKSQIVEIMAMRGVICTEEEILLTAGAQQGISLLTRLFLDSHSSVIIEELAYPGMLQALKPYSPTILTVTTDLKTGIAVEEIEALLKTGVRPAFIYVVTDGGNPHAASISTAKRKRLAELSCFYEVPVIEDDPYGFLNFSAPQPPIKKYGKDWIFYVGSFSKILAPSLRVGWVVAPKAIVEKLSSLKECSDINIATFAQRALSAMLKKPMLKPHIDKLCREYVKKRDCMLAALEQYFPAQAKFIKPDAGIFIWVELPKEINTLTLLDEAIKNQVAFIPSAGFAVDKKKGQQHSLRLNFSFSTPDKIQLGIKRLGMTIKEFVKETI